MRFRCADSQVSCGQERAVSKVSGLVWTGPYLEPELLQLFIVICSFEASLGISRHARFTV